MSHLPTLSKELEHTLRAWIARVGTDGFYAIRQVFPADTPSDCAHRRNCRLLVRKGLLEPESRVGEVASCRRVSTDQLMSARFRSSV